MRLSDRPVEGAHTSGRAAHVHALPSSPSKEEQAHLAHGALDVYKTHISEAYNGVRGSQCGYHASCSGFAREAMHAHGLAGLPQVLARLRRCTSESHLYRLSQLLRYTAQCPESRLGDLFHFETEETKQAFLTFRTEVLAGAAHLAAGGDVVGIERIESAIRHFTSTTHFALEDRVDRPGEPSGFHLSPRRLPHPIVMADRGPVGNALRATAAVAVAAPAALVGAVGGAAVGMGVGGVEGLSAGLGLDPALESYASARWGVGSLNGTTKMRGALHAFHRDAHDVLGFQCLADLVGGPAGLIIGVVGGGISGLTTGATVAWRMGRILGRSVSDEALGAYLPSRGRIEIEGAHGAVASTPSLAFKGVDAERRAQKMWNVLTDVPEALRNPNRLPSAPTWRFAVFSDATSPSLESAEIRRVLEFEQNLPQGATARVHLRRGGIVPARVQRALPWLQLGSSVAALAAVSSVGGVSLAPALVTRALSVGVSLEAGKELIRDHLTAREGDWTGQRTYAIDQAASTKADHIQASPVEIHPAVLPAGAASLTGQLMAAFQQEGPRVAIFSGHGRSHEDVAGHDPKVLGDALAEVARQTGRKTDLVVLEACFTGTLEALRPLAAGARYALVSQLPMRKVGLPWHHILRNIDDLGQSPRALGCGIVELAGGTQAVPSLSLIDLEQVEGLAQALESLAQTVSTEVLSKALPAGTLERSGTWGQRLSDALGRLAPGSQSGDLERILDTLAGLSHEPSVTEQVARVRQALQRAVVTERGDHLGGLSVETRSFFFDQSRYVSATGMTAWGERLGEMQPRALVPSARVASRVREGLDATNRFVLEKRFGARLP